jgi:hypothetical protein
LPCCLPQAFIIVTAATALLAITLLPIAMKVCAIEPCHSNTPQSTIEAACISPSPSVSTFGVRQLGSDRNQMLKLFMLAPSSVIKLLSRRARNAYEAMKQRQNDSEYVESRNLDGDGDDENELFDVRVACNTAPCAREGWVGEITAWWRWNSGTL